MNTELMTEKERLKSLYLDEIKTTIFTYTDIPLRPGEEYIDVIQALLDNALIEPVKSSKRTKIYPYFYIKYRKVKETFSLVLPPEEEKEILSLYPLMQAPLLDEPEFYRMNRTAIQQLSSWLMSDHDKTVISEKERAYEIWGREKALEPKINAARDIGFGREICRKFGLTNNDLFCRRTTELFIMAYLGVDGDILILENKDPFASLLDVLSANSGRLGGAQIGYLIYGQGKEIARRGTCEEDTLTGFLKNYGLQNHRVWYAGDIDCEGVHNIYYACKNSNPELQILPFSFLYRKMVQKYMQEPRPLQYSADGASRRYEEEFLYIFSPPEQEIVRRILENGQLLPQEILNKKDYLAYAI